jgi:hydroxymethylbilane synthase
MRIGTRDSELAMRQTEIFVEMLKDRFPGIEVEVVPMKTTGDLDLKSSLDSLQGFGAFDAVVRGGMI